jgi:glyoxylase I family protein
MYEGIHHVSLLVTGVEKAKQFYGEVLGFKESDGRPDFDFPGVWYQIGNTQIHLIKHDEGKTLRGTNELDSRDGHFAMRVTDMNALIERLDSYSIDYLDKFHNKTNWHQVYVTDPDGNLIEFNK